MREQELVPYAPARLPAGPWLVFAPHPDDEVLGMGGTLALAARAGIRVEVVVLTGGELAGDPAARRAEALAAGALLGVARHHFWDLPDRNVAGAPLPRQALAELLAELAPLTVFLPALQEYHPDHRATARRLRALLPARAGVWHYEITRQSEANQLVDISAVAALKADAVRCFASQLEVGRYDAVAAGLNQARALTLGPTVTHAEAFFAAAAAGDQLEAVRRYAVPERGPEEHPPLVEPRVSVIVRTRDRPALLAEALGSIAAQTYRLIDVIVVNDGGCDVTLVVAAALPAARLVTLPESRGRAAAANRGLAEARAPLVAFLDDDDLYLPEAIAALVADLGSAAAVQGRVVMRHHDTAGRPLPDASERRFDQPFDRRALLVGNTIPLNALLFRRAVLDEIGPFREDLPFLEDWELLLRLGDRHTPRTCAADVAVYRSFGGVSTAGGTRFPDDAFAPVERDLMRQRWLEVGPEEVQAWGRAIARAAAEEQRWLAREVARLRPPAPAPRPRAASPARARGQVLLLCPEPLRAQQQGIGLRFREMAAELGAEQRVILYAPNRDAPTAPGHETRVFDAADVLRELPETRAVIVQGHLSAPYLAALDRAGVTDPPPLVCDLYDPFLVENLSYTQTLGPGVYHHDRGVLLQQLARGDRFLVSSRAQIAFYMGLMMGHGSFVPGDEVESLFIVAPFGARQAAPPPPRPQGGEPVVFFGGIYDWYDPHLLLDALEDPGPDHPPRILFSKNPNPGTTPQRVFASVEQRVARSPALAARVTYLPWLPRAELAARLATVDVAVSLHHQGLETDISLRTRIIDYLAAGVPVIATEGGEAASILRASGGGLLVAPGDRDGLRAALRELLGDRELRRRLGARGRAWVAEHMSWAQTLAPLLDYCQDPTPRRPRAAPAPAPATPPAITAGDGGLLFSVVIASYNGRAFLGDCLSSIEAGTFPRHRYEVIVVDNGSQDDSRALLRDRFPAVRVVALERNTGFTGAVAAGAPVARGDKLVFLNNDMRVSPGWLAAFADAGVPCAAGAIHDFSGGKIDFIGGLLTFDGHALQRCQGLPAASFRDLRPGPTFIACGGNMAVDRALFARLGGFDDDYFAYLEDVDFSWRLHAAGGAIQLVPGALAYHHGQGTSTPTLGVYRRGLLFETNAFATLYKNIEEPYFDAMLHAAWRTLINRTVHIFGEHASAPFTLRALRRPRSALSRGLRLVSDYIDGNGGKRDLSHPHAAMQLEAVTRVLADLDRLHAKRAAAQRLRVRSDADIFRAFPPWVIDTYPGDRALFASPAFRALLPRDIPFRFATAGEVHDGTAAPIGDHPDA